ncbi:MAG: helix-turn-helix domain-containing protein [Euryarchaeota archaeon]|jgi:predicted transcriptional regulator|nr:helix-turn-helix domain-containing protein [Euryarchaeota archaeon]
MGRERMLAVVLAGLLVVMAPNAFADTSEVTLDAEIVNSPDKGWYASGDTVELSAILSNDGDASSITVDPSCNQILRVWSSNSVVFDGADSCLGQSRGMDLDADSSITLDTLSWDLTDSNGDYVPSGDYSIEYFIAGEELSSTVNIHVQTPSVVPDGLDFQVTVTARDGVHAEASPSIITARLHNTLDQEMPLDFGNCKLSINSQLFGMCGPSSLSANQIVTIAQIPISIESGENLISISLGDNVLAKEVSIIAVEDDDLGSSVGNLEDLSVELILEEGSSFGESDLFISDINMKNTGLQNVSIDFTTSCRGEIWIVNSAGEVVMDSRSLKECSELDVQNMLSPGSVRGFAQPDWAFIGTDGCLVGPGVFTVIAEIPEHDLFSTSTIDLSRGSVSNCQSDTIEITAELSGEEILQIVPEIFNPIEDEITWLSTCDLEITLVGAEGELGRILTHCDNTVTLTTRFTSLELDSVEFDMSAQDDGEYTLFFSTFSDPAVQSTINFEWPMLLDEEIVENNSQEVEDIVSSIVVAGTWSSTNTELGVCWLLNSPDEGIITLAGAPGLTAWSPEMGSTGQYLIHESDPAPECSDFAATAFVVEEVYSQESFVSSEETQDEAAITPEVIQEQKEISPVVITIGMVVASGGILSILGALIATNESWRIPTTSAGLWILGLIGRTSETSDGRYQRGRLMGYLTANPGCHFRALMAALEMSNGQITHHLKVLENEESIWRRSDGRLVRFYPFTSHLHPGIMEEDLPLPPLSPDPNSLQGKILRLLDDDGNMKKYPTQAELAHRLDRSQQLVSHHLRTLQKFGLVEKQKTGVRNRYRLTREAVFLLDTTEM